jgi:AcrR family transcriptional regulator
MIVILKNSVTYVFARDGGRMKAANTQHERVREASRVRRERRRSELRLAILDAAAELFLERGYEQFSMRQVAERVGYTATTIYRYFADKDALIFAVVDRGFERFGAALDEAAASTTDPVERLFALGRAYVAFGLANRAYYQLMFMQRSDYLAAAPAEAKEPRYATFLTLQRAVEAAIEDGVIRRGDALEYSHAIWALVHGIVSIALTLGEHVGLDADRTFATAMDLLFDGARAR